MTNQLPATLLFISIVVVATVLGGLAVPLVLGKIGPNVIYGFRTERTLSNPEIWYIANAFAGKLSIVCSSIMYVLAIIFLILARCGTMRWSNLLSLASSVLLVPPVILLIVLLLYNARLPANK